jgi:Fe-S-cluster-containing dehydrogenase component
MVIDQERCIGCEACSIACRIENKTKNFLIQVDTQSGGEKDTPKGKFPNLEMNFLPYTCNHCNNPPCVEVCPTDALIKREEGPVILEKELCNGCKACMNACPYNVIIFDADNNIIEKCNFCIHRIEDGLEPFCVICCEGQALSFGDLNDSNSKISKIISERQVFQLKPEEKTDLSIYYCPPRLKRRL